MIHLSAKKGANPSNWVFYRSLVIAKENSNNKLVSYFQSKPRVLLSMLVAFEQSSNKPKLHESRYLRQQNLMIKMAELSQFGSDKTLPYRKTESIDWFFLWNFLNPNESAIISAWTGSILGDSAERWFPFKSEKVNLNETEEEQIIRENEEDWFDNLITYKMEIFETTNQDMACAVFLTAAYIGEANYSIFILDMNMRKKYWIPCKSFIKFIT